MVNEQDRAFFAARGFGNKIGFGRQPAVLVIDLVNAFTHPDRPLGAELGPQIEAANILVDAAHSHGIPVFFSTVAYDEPDVRDAGIWALKQKGIASLFAGGDGPEIDRRLHRRQGDALMPKKYASCFFGTDLVPRLVCAGVDTLVIAGCTTSGCVRASAVDACQNGFRPMVVCEAVGDRSAAAHEQSLFDLQAKYADVVSLREATDYLSTLGGEGQNPGAKR